MPLKRAVGRAIRKSCIAREEIFLVTKLFPNTYKTASAQIDKTLKMLQVDYLDLLLLHQPYGKVENAWKACENAVDSGKVKAIGVCNFTEKDMDKLLDYAKYDIKLEAWYPLGHGDTGLLNEAVFDRLSKKYNKSKV